jgi:ribosome-binding protein aMBF1 (putative translation factor)
MDTTTTLPILPDVPDVRARILARLEKLKWSNYKLAKAVEPQGIRPQTVYDFLAGRSTINSDYLGHLLDALGLDLREKR